MSGPLQGVRIIEVAALGPVPFAGMLLADMGAEVIRVDRVAPPRRVRERASRRIRGTGTGAPWHWTSSGPRAWTCCCASRKAPTC